MKRLRALLRGATLLDVAVVAGVICIAHGFSQVPAPWGSVLAPIVLGLGLIGTVRFGAS